MWWTSDFTIQLCFHSILESVAYEFGPGRGLITYTYPEDRRPEMKSDVIALGFITSQEDAVLLRIDSGTSNDYMELELVSALADGLIMNKMRVDKDWLIVWLFEKFCNPS